MVAVAAFILDGCAAPGFVIHRMPAETPAADNAEALERQQALAKEKQQADQEQAQKEREPTDGESGAQVPVPLTPADAPSMKTYDPWERLNRINYRFNAGFDEAVFLPVSNAYRRLPGPIRTAAHNFFDNLSEVDSVINYTLQGRLGRGVRSLGRFVVNSTLGIGGLFDVAAHLRLADPLTGFGITLARWGMHPGPYLVIPLLGPATLRDGIGRLADYGVCYGINLADLYRGYQSWALGTLNAVNQRAGNDFRYYSSGSPFEYETIRFLYVHRELIEDEALHARTPPRARDRATPAGQ